MSCGCDGPSADQRHIGRQSNLGNELATPQIFYLQILYNPQKKEQKHEKDRTSTLPVSRDLNLSTSPKILNKKTNDKNTEKSNQSGKKKYIACLERTLQLFFVISILDLGVLIFDLGVLIWDLGVLIFGSWSFDFGSWSFDFGSWIFDFGPWSFDFGSWSFDFGSWSIDFGSWSFDFGSCIFNFGSWSFDFGSWSFDFGSWIFDFGSWIFLFWILEF